MLYGNFPLKGDIAKPLQMKITCNTISFQYRKYALLC